MNINSKIAFRYLFGKKSTNAINLITSISIIGIAIGTAALILILSVFNGFEKVLSGLFNSFNPDLKVSLKEGKFFTLSDKELGELAKIDGVLSVSRTIEEVCFFEYNGSQEVGRIKGVDENYQSVTEIDSIINRGSFILKEKSASCAVLGNIIFGKLSINPSDHLTPLNVYMLKRKKTGPLSKDYKSLPLYPKGTFVMGGEEDNQFVIASFAFVNALLELKNHVSALEIKISDNANVEKIKNSIKDNISVDVDIKNRYEQDEDFLKVMNIEKWISYLIATLTMLIIAFNMIAALWMIILDKKQDIAILKSLGFNDSNIKLLFSKVGVFIGVFGLILGIVLALIFYFLQLRYGIIGVPSGFMIDAYPISLKFLDFVVVIITVVTICFFAALLPASRSVKTIESLKIS